MTIPLDNLYDYIFSLTGHNNKNLRMYRFSPHGSKSIKNLICHNNVDEVYVTLPNGYQRTSSHYKLLFCYDQEPLDFSLYENNIDDIKKTFAEKGLSTMIVDNPISKKIQSKKNISSHRMVIKTIYDKKLLLHSEKNSKDLQIYEKNGFIGIYYWSHAFIALDWYRFAKHDKTLNFVNERVFDKDFNIYCRAWSGSREYRLKFMSLISKYHIDKSSNIFFNDHDNSTNYENYVAVDNKWLLDKEEKNNIKNLICKRNQNPDSALSATYDFLDYKNSAIDVVLETVVDRKKIHLTEKILRPIACGKPFILVSEFGSLAFLKSYGFKTFNNLIDESYDNIEDPLKRLEKIIMIMNEISILSPRKKANLYSEMHKISEENKKWFFSEDFFNIINKELHQNLSYAFKVLENPEYQTAKELKKIYRAYRRYKKYLSGDFRKLADDIINEYPDVIRLSKKNIGKY